MSRTLRILTLGCALSLIAGIAGAELFTVTFTNGMTTQTRYRPVLSDDDSTVYMLTDQGNRISMPRSAVADVVAEVEQRGYGLQINTTTLSLGIAPNERMVGEEEGGEISDTRALLNYLQDQNSGQENYSVEQFVDTEQSTGIPVGMTNNTTPPLGGVDNN